MVRLLNWPRPSVRSSTYRRMSAVPAMTIGNARLVMDRSHHANGLGQLVRLIQEDDPPRSLQAIDSSLQIAGFRPPAMSPGHGRCACRRRFPPACTGTRAASAPHGNKCKCRASLASAPAAPASCLCRPAQRSPPCTSVYPPAAPPSESCGATQVLTLPLGFSAAARRASRSIQALMRRVSSSLSPV